MRVALFTETFLPKVDGIVTVICLLLDHLAKCGIDSVIVAPRRGVRRYAHTDVIGVPGVPFPMYPELQVGPPTLHIYRQVKAFKPDIAHYIHPTVIGTGGILMNRRLRVPSVASFHLDLVRIARFFGLSFISPLTWWYTRQTFNAASYALAPSRLIQRDLIEHGVRHVGLWRRGVDADKFNPRYRSETMRAALSDGHPDQPILLYVGRLSKEKQIEQLKPVLEQVPDVRLAIVGDGPNRAALERHFAGTPTRFMGYLKGEALSQAYASADIFTFPSALETFGLVVVEAMAAGLPVVSSRVGGVVDVIRPGVTGYTFEVDDVGGLIEGVRAIISKPGARERMGIAARAYAEKQSWPAIMDELIEGCYQPLLEGQTPNL